MNKFTLIAAALVLSAGSAFASKARVGALQGSPTIKDSTDVLTKPDQAMKYGDALMLEFGATNHQATTNGEGGFIRKGDNSAWGLYFGNRNVSATALRSAVTTATFLAPENSMNLIYATGMGDMTVGGGLFYSKSSHKPDTGIQRTQDAMGLYASAEAKAGWDAAISLGLANNAKETLSTTSENKQAGKTSYVLSGGNKFGSIYGFASYTAGGAKSDNSGTDIADVTKNLIKLGAEDSFAKDGATFIYGAAYNMETTKNTVGDVKVEHNYLNVWAAIEAEAASWLVLRGSISQSALMDSNKTSAAGSTLINNDNADSTTVAAGAGLKFGKMMFDGTLSATGGAASTGTFGTDGANFLASTSFTYVF
jgi:hypothetical protein